MLTPPFSPFGRVLATLGLLVVAFLATGSLQAAAASDSFGPPGAGRLIVLGFDGGDARTVGEMMDAGQLPNLARLRDQGTFGGLDSTVPCESPVSWASLNSGQNPAKTGIAGFVKRSHMPWGPSPDLGLRTMESRPLESFELDPMAGFLSSFRPLTASAIVGGIVLLGFLIVFVGLLRIKNWTAPVLAILLAGVGAWGTYEASGYLPEEIQGIAGNPVQAGGFWEVAAQAGVESIVLDAAMAWDRPTIKGARVLAGLGVPDIRGQNGDWFVYTTADKETRRAPEGRSTSTAGTVFRVDEVDGRVDSAVFGPKNFWRIDMLAKELAAIEEAIGDPDKGFEAIAELRRKKADVSEEHKAAQSERLSLPLTVERLEDSKVQVSIGVESAELRQGEWSDWFRLTFDMNPLLKARAVTRVKVVSLSDPLELFVNILEIDPSAPPFWQPISQPPSFSAELASSIGEPYETVGWACLTMPYKDEEIDEETFLEDIQFTQDWRQRLTYACLEQNDWRLLMSVESTVDRVQHMMYRYYDTGHPQYDAEQAARKIEYFGETITYSDVIPATYRQIDKFVGKVMDEFMRPEDTLLLCADHGFQSFRRQVNINNWLEANGYLTLKSGVTSRDRNTLSFVDWSRTKAYSLGLGMIFLNIKGRERDGIVAPDDVPALIEEIQDKLLASRDGDTKTVDEVYKTADIHGGPFLDDECDILTGFAPPYRVSWRTTLGGIKLRKTDDGSYVAGPIYEDNKEPWSGDHVSMSRSAVRGMFFCNRPVKLPEGGFDLLDVAPTALSILGVTPPAEYDRPPLEFQ
jgi:predicted AlkP superfamily phosphohydrolase/phosphomutase